MKNTVLIILGVLLMAACGQSYEETKQLTKKQRMEAARKDSAALKVAVMPTLDCLPLYVAQHYNLYDTLRGGVRLKYYKAQMDCDTAMERGRVEGAVTDLVRAMRMAKRGTKMRYVATTNAYWQLVSNRNSRVKLVKQLDDKMIAMTRYSVTDMLADAAIDSAKLDKDRVFKVQINDVSVRLLMLQNNEMDALWLTEPQSTCARLMKHNVVYDTKKEDLRLGALVFREKEMQRQARSLQLKLFVDAYNKACDSINKYGIHHYSRLIASRCRIKDNMADSLPNRLKYDHAVGPREIDFTLAEKWLGKNEKPKEKKAAAAKTTGKKAKNKKVKGKKK